MTLIWNWKLRFSTKSLFKITILISMSTGGFEQPDVSPCKIRQILNLRKSRQYIPASRTWLSSSPSCPWTFRSSRGSPSCPPAPSCHPRGPSPSSGRGTRVSEKQFVDATFIFEEIVVAHDFPWVLGYPVKVLFTLMGIIRHDVLCADIGCTMNFFEISEK